jgi:hypothetical protein
MGDESAVAVVLGRLEQVERGLRETLSLLHDLADRLQKLERAVGLMYCSQLDEFKSKGADAEITRLLKFAPGARSGSGGRE